MGWQVALAITALAIGIPHGALDHLITLPKNQPKKMAIFITVYVAVAVVAVIGILNFNTIGFCLVLLMSAVHFGIGDAAFINEIDKRAGSESKLNRYLYIPAAGFTPVFIPLVNSASTEALAKVNPALINWHQGFDHQILLAVSIFALFAIVVLAISKRVRESIDIALLLGLALLTPPLIAFAVYFGCWHAMRHTARLTLTLASSQDAFAQGDSSKAFTRAVIPGIPALLGTFLIAGAFEVSYERIIDDESAFGTSLFLTANDDISNKFMLTPYYRYYFGRKPAAGFFAEGFGLHANPYFNQLPLDGTKGELFIIKAPDLDLDVIVNTSVFILPLGNDLFKVGATYNWKDKTDVPTEEGKNELVERIQEIIRCDFEIVSHFAGVRPTVRDRRPLVGTHAVHDRIHVLNGLGTRGVMLGPAMAKALYNAIENQISLNKEIDIQRFVNKKK